MFAFTSAELLFNLLGSGVEEFISAELFFNLLGSGVEEFIELL